MQVQYYKHTFVVTELSKNEEKLLWEALQPLPVVIDPLYEGETKVDKYGALIGNITGYMVMTNDDKLAVHVKLLLSEGDIQPGLSQPDDPANVAARERKYAAVTPPN